jgi:hypothetical protein
VFGILSLWGYDFTEFAGEVAKRDVGGGYSLLATFGDRCFWDALKASFRVPAHSAQTPGRQDGFA